MTRNVSRCMTDTIIAAAAKKAAKETKKVTKEAEKAAKKVAKEAEKAAKKAAKEAEKAAKKAAKEAKLNDKVKERELTRAIKAHVAEKLKQRTEKLNKRKAHKFDVQQKTLQHLIPVAKAIAAQYPDGFTTKQFSNFYISKYGRINPYTTEPLEPSDKYDIHAAIRGIMFETSPSSAQHWFRYGMQKVREQVAPWVFANKQLAIVNASFNWKITTKEMSRARCQNKGLWTYMANGSHAFYDWSVEEYGPLPTEEVLKEAAIGRKIGIRGRKCETRTINVDI